MQTIIGFDVETEQTVWIYNRVREIWQTVQNADLRECEYVVVTDEDLINSRIIATNEKDSKGVRLYPMVKIHRTELATVEYMQRMDMELTRLKAQFKELQNTTKPLEPLDIINNMFKELVLPKGDFIRLTIYSKNSELYFTPKHIISGDGLGVTIKETVKEKYNYLQPLVDYITANWDYLDSYMYRETDKYNRLIEIAGY